jgi:hypothetical protein
MADSIDDGDAINYAAQFYAAIANGQSIKASHLSGQAALELTGLDGAELPSLAWAQGVDPATTILVKPAGSGRQSPGCGTVAVSRTKQAFWRNTVLPRFACK